MNQNLSETQFYHGTTASLVPGDMVLPGKKTHHRISSAEHAYASTSQSGAWEYAEMAQEDNGQAARVYKVAPVGPHEPDPNDHWGGHRSTSGWRVLSEESPDVRS